MDASLPTWPTHAENAAVALESLGLTARADAVRRASTMRAAIEAMWVANEVCDDICDWDRFLTGSGAGTTLAEHNRVNEVGMVVLKELSALEEMARHCEHCTQGQDCAVCGRRAA